MTRHLLLVWSAAWRAQLSHLALFALLPAVAAAVQIALVIVLLPFVLQGFGDGSRPLGAQVAHLASPGCWLALAPCPLADIGWLPLPFPEGAAGAGPEPMFPMPRELNLRHVWFVVWLGWFLAFLIARERRPRGS